MGTRHGNALGCRWYLDLSIIKPTQNSPRWCGVKKVSWQTMFTSAPETITQTRRGIYTDLSFFTSSKKLAHEVAQVFNFVTGYAEPEGLKHLLVSPLSLRDALLDNIQKEVEFAKNDQPAAIWAKMNSLVDPQIIDAFYRASQAGGENRFGGAWHMLFASQYCRNITKY